MMMRPAFALLLALPSLLVAQTTPPKPAPRTGQVPVVRQVREAPLASAERWDRAYFAWEAGRYPDALTDLKAILAATDAAEYQDRIAELTGERWRTMEVAKDARAPRWSPDGRSLAFETGTGAARRVKVVRAEAGLPVVLEAAGGAPTFSPDGRVVAWVQQAANGRPSILWSRLDGSAPESIALDAGAVTGLTLIGRAPLQLVAITGNVGDSTSTLRVRDLTGSDGTWRTIAMQRGQPVEILRAANGQRAFVITGERGAFARTVPGFTRVARTTGFALLDPAARGPLAVSDGTALTLSLDGQSYAFATTAMTTTVISAVRSGAAPVDVHRSATPVQALAMAPDGSRVAWQTMLREDWELFAATTTANAEPQRVTREIQHDLQPQFLTPTRLLGLVGEARHRRSHLYDLGSGVRTRLFHNNSVRTVAPEYEWVPSPDGTRVAIVAERDGDTVTPHRHLYVTDLSTPVTNADLVARVDSNLAAERALRATGERMFAPIALAVRDATAAVDVGRIYSYEKDLFAFDSKHITQPGNARAVQYLLDKYRSFGLQAHLQPFRTLAGSEIEVNNVVAVVPGTVNPELVYVVGAHFDSRAEGPGADDNTSGTAMILEAARVLAKRPQLATVMFVSFTGEEAGLRGAREFGRRMKDSIQVVGALNNDMMGWANDHRMDNTIRYSNPGIRDLQHAAAIQFSRLITYDAFYYKSTDAQALFDAWGDIIGGIGSYPILGNPHYHMPHDVLETIDHQQLAETARTTVATIMLLASSPSRLNGLTATGRTVTWTGAREKGVTRYIVRYGPATDPMRFSATVTAPRATLPSLRAGWQVAVKAVNARGLEGWDWARAEVK
jgi:hypothetical protein